jgi:hypothetical protein
MEFAATGLNAPAFKTAKRPRAREGRGIELSSITSHYDLAHRASAIMASNKKPRPAKPIGVGIKCLTMTYSHMGKPHTTIGAERFHF